MRAPEERSPASTAADGGRPAVGPWVLVGGTLLLFLVWSNTFLAFEVLLAPAHGTAPMRWWDLVVARFVPVVLVCATWCFAVRGRESLQVLRRHGRRLAVCGLLVAPGYGSFMYYGIAHRVSGPVASLLTTLAPLYMMALGVLVFRERIGRRAMAGLVLGFSGVALVATARTGEGVRALDVVLLGLSQVCWAVHSILTKPMMRTVEPLLWTYLVHVVGGLPLLLLAPFVGGPAMAALDLQGWALLLYLSLFATVLGNALWSWLLRHLPASTTGLTVFLNPPMTTVSKWVLASLLPFHFAFSIRPQEWLGGALALTGVALAILPRRPAPAVAVAPVEEPLAAARRG